MIVFVVSGIWHGAAWTFLIWGTIHGVGVAGQRLVSSSARGRRFLDLWGSTMLGRASQVLLTFHAITLTWIFFRAGSMEKLSDVFSGMELLTPDGLLRALSHPDALWGCGVIVLLEVLQWIHRGWNCKSLLASLPTPVRWGFWYALGAIILLFGRFGNEQFLYFQF